MATKFDRLRNFIFRRRRAYRAVFQPGGVLGPSGEIVIADLRDFCRATSTPAVVSPGTQSIDPMATGIAIGRLEVWHRIMQNIHVSDADLYKLVERERERLQGGDQEE
jgi:hypothetical protein